MVALAIMAILLVGFAVADVQGEAEIDFTLRGIEGKNHGFHDNSHAKSGGMKQGKNSITGLETQRKLGDKTDDGGRSTPRNFNPTDYCKFPKSIGKSCPGAN